MVWLLMWLNKNITIINVTIQFLDIDIDIDCIWLEVGGYVSWKFLFFLMWVANMDNSGFFERN